ncbi:MAG: hypothetical protein ACLFST_01460 [Spirochaetia bacterium]
MATRRTKLKHIKEKKKLLLVKDDLYRNSLRYVSGPVVQAVKIIDAGFTAAQIGSAFSRRFKWLRLK